MSKLKKDLVLGDYVPVHVTDAKENQSRARFGVPIDFLEQHAAFFQRIVKERKELNVATLRKAA